LIESEGKIMALRGPEIPTNRERSALQLATRGNWVVRNDLYPLERRRLRAWSGRAGLNNGSVLREPGNFASQNG
jgi:hypothetical protein